MSQRLQRRTRERALTRVRSEGLDHRSMGRPEVAYAIPASRKGMAYRILAQNVEFMESHGAPGVVSYSFVSFSSVSNAGFSMLHNKHY